MAGPASPIGMESPASRRGSADAADAGLARRGSTIRRLDSPVNCLGCLGSRMAAASSPSSKASQEPIQLSAANPAARTASLPMDPGMTAEPTDGALETAIARRGPEGGCLHHSGRGSRHTSPLIGEATEENGIAPPMGSASSPWDNAATESLMGAVKAECVHARAFSGREEAALEMFERIECFYNRIRIRPALGWLSPEEFEKKQMEESRLKAA